MSSGAPAVRRSHCIRCTLRRSGVEPVRVELEGTVRVYDLCPECRAAPDVAGWLGRNIRWALHLDALRRGGVSIVPPHCRLIAERIGEPERQYRGVGSGGALPGLEGRRPPPLPK